MNDTLAAYYHLFKTGDLSAAKRFRDSELMPFLQTYSPRARVKEDKESRDEFAAEASDVEQLKAEIHDYCDAIRRIKAANSLLAERNLVNYHIDDQGVIILRPTLSGWDLGREYASRWQCLRHWFDYHLAWMFSPLSRLRP